MTPFYLKHILIYVITEQRMSNNVTISWLIITIITSEKHEYMQCVHCQPKLHCGFKILAKFNVKTYFKVILHYFSINQFLSQKIHNCGYALRKLFG